MTDSREIMEARTNPAITIFISVVLFLLVAGLTWSFIGEIDEVAKASGIVRPNEKVSNIQTTATGTIETIHVKEGQMIEQGALIISFEHESLELDLKNKGLELTKLQQETLFLQRYKESVVGHVNLFNKSISDEDFYYHLVEQYLLEYSQKEIDFQNSKRQIEQAKGESLLANENVALNRRSSNQKNAQSKSEYNRNIEQLEKDLEAEKQLKQSIENKKNVIPGADLLRTERFNQFMLRLEQLNTTVRENETKLAQSIELGERFVSKSQLETEKAQVEAAKLQLSQFEQESLLGVQSRIEEYETKLKEARRALAQLNAEDSPTVLEQEALQLEEEKLRDQYQSLETQSEGIEQKTAIDLEKFRLDRIVQIGAAIDEKEKSLKALQDQVEQLKLAIDKQSIHAPISGIVHVLKELNTGDIVQPGEPLLSIIPVNESMYKMSIAVPNHEIGQIVVGQNVDMNFHAFPKQSFGSLTGTVNSISTDSIVQQDGRSYYSVEASIANEPLVNRKGESGEIRVGMTAEAYVITDSKKIIHFLLEKINLKE
ncbi:HlyD family efflux transporter periplasmic adaptor subunit [Paenibacillus sp. 1011MAR3C5]|uniref:HlyD family efflux transporter periplasmic adaptor subunit n=1 Tax=Paenibacillus sp. 1011MAR3C5 TaxID=1675787 RepID=UPI00160107E5|nr:HlyD family efflux transporter periplasmic adaptor subunit [Paenibacillus sp. 1011MAR3C5]